MNFVLPIVAFLPIMVIGLSVTGPSGIQVTSVTSPTTTTAPSTTTNFASCFPTNPGFTLNEVILNLILAKGTNDFASFVRDGIVCPSATSAWDCPTDCIKHHQQVGGYCNDNNYCICGDSVNNQTPNEAKGPAGGPDFDAASKCFSNNPVKNEASDLACAFDCTCVHDTQKWSLNTTAMAIDNTFACDCYGPPATPENCTVNFFCLCRSSCKSSIRTCTYDTTINP